MIVVCAHFIVAIFMCVLHNVPDSFTGCYLYEISFELQG